LGKQKNIILIGVAGVGKTTLGKLAAKKFGMSFVDGDMGFEDVEGSDIDTLLERYGEEEFDSRLLTYFAKQINKDEHTIFAASARITHYKGFWKVVKLNGVSIHLRGKPMEVYIRQDVWVKGRKLTKEEKLKKQWKRDFYDYL
jgi:shikimate kinase